MEPERKKMIVKEIEYWRRSKLLPEQYCDFLLNLYAEETSAEKKGGATGFSMKLRSGHWLFWLLGFVLISIISFVALHFNSFSAPMQIAVSAIFIVPLYAAGFWRKRKSPLWASALVGIASLLLLLIGEYVLRQETVDLKIAVGYVAVCGVLWLIFGLVFRIVLLHVCGWLSLALFYCWWIYRVADDIQLTTLQLFWLPICFLLAWAGWMIRKKALSEAVVLIIVSLLFWFAPEIYDMVVQGISETSQLALGGKLLAAAAVLFFMRKKWTGWIAS